MKLVVENYIYCPDCSFIQMKCDILIIHLQTMEWEVIVVLNYNIIKIDINHISNIGASHLESTVFLKPVHSINTLLWKVFLEKIRFCVILLTVLSMHRSEGVAKAMSPSHSVRSIITYDCRLTQSNSVVHTCSGNQTIISLNQIWILLSPSVQLKKDWTCFEIIDCIAFQTID